MSEQELELSRRANAAFNRGDFDEWGKYFDPDVVFEDHNPGPDQEAVTRGLDKLRRIAEHWREAMPDMRIDVVEDVDAGDAVVSRVVYRGTGDASGASLEQEMVDVAWFKDGRITRVSSGHLSIEGGLEVVDKVGRPQD